MNAVDAQEICGEGTAPHSAEIPTPAEITPSAYHRLTARATGEGLEVEVSDTGVGIAPQELPHIFAEFRQDESGPTFTLHFPADRTATRDLRRRHEKGGTAHAGAVSISGIAPQRSPLPARLERAAVKARRG
jgi:hypothetical protein